MTSRLIPKLTMTLMAAVSLLWSPGTAYAQQASAAPDLRAAARDSYIFTYPLVMMYRTMYLQALDSSSPSFSGGMGQWLHLGVASPADTDIVTPNNDTPYSYAWVDLRAEPWVLTIPEIATERFYTSQWDDLWGYVLDNAGSVNDGNGGVSVLLAGPTWSGDLPVGIDRAIRGECWFLGTLTRTQVLGAGDVDALRGIQDSYELQPLSAFLDASAPPPAAPVDWLPWRDGAEDRLEYWDHVAGFCRSSSRKPRIQRPMPHLQALGSSVESRSTAPH